MVIDENPGVEKRVNTVQNEKKKSSNAKIRGPYNAYTPYKIQCLIDLLFLCGYSARKAALELVFAMRTAQHYCRQYRLEDKVLPGIKPQSGRAPKKLFPKHTKSLVDYFDQRVTATLWQARDELYEKFSVSVSLTAVHNHLVNDCTVTFKKLEKLPVARITPRVISLRKQMVEDWERDLNMDCMKNCVLIDETRFNLHLRRNFGRSKIGTSAKAVVLTNRGIDYYLWCYLSWGYSRFDFKKTSICSSPKEKKEK